MSVVTSTPFIICLAILGACIFAIVVLDIAGCVPQARELLARQQSTGQHAVKGKRSHARTPEPAGPQGKADPFADLDDAGDDDEEAADEFIAALHGGEEHYVNARAMFAEALRANGLYVAPEPAGTRPEAVPALSAPVAPAEAETPAEPPPPLVAALEPLPPMAVITADPEPPVDRGTLESRREWAPPTADLLARLRDSLKALPGGGEPARVPDGMPAGPAPVLPSRKRAVPDWLTTSGVNAFLPVLELGDVGEYVDRVFAPAEQAVSAAVAEHLGSDENGQFFGTSLPGLPEEDWDLTRPVLAMPGGTVAAGDKEGAA